ncbi:outer membrane protein [Tropicimonas sp. IMCC6043]|uniref:outer membrane protein n=1 Tax=Tropicimonas sp. IMCC6043 TaxID=2510645 RepID=UPI00101C95B1|nr:outer membrane beta-barrel protein [Tropicimonas sp. IMCC6043]RYH10390.1 porin family protein [Tropicimonas sp. IMCC6043]
MTQTHFATACVLTLLCGQAVADELIPASVAPFREPPLMVDRFIGAHAGVSLGFAAPGNDEVGISGPGIAGTEDIGELGLGGAGFALQVGYRWDLDTVLLGVEASARLGNISADFDTDAGEGSNELTGALSLRGELGWEARSDTLFYGFAGATLGSFDYELSRTGGGEIDDSFSRTGYIGGVGVERALNETWSLRGEYQYSNFGSEELEGAGGYSTKVTPDFHSFSLGLNYSFGR